MAYLLLQYYWFKLTRLHIFLKKRKKKQLCPVIDNLHNRRTGQTGDLHTLPSTLEADRQSFILTIQVSRYRVNVDLEVFKGSAMNEG